MRRATNGGRRGAGESGRLPWVLVRLNGQGRPIIPGGIQGHLKDLYGVQVSPDTGPARGPRPPQLVGHDPKPRRMRRAMRSTDGARSATRDRSSNTVEEWPKRPPLVARPSSPALRRPPLVARPSSPALRRPPFVARRRPPHIRRSRATVSTPCPSRLAPRSGLARVRATDGRGRCSGAGEEPDPDAEDEHGHDL